MQICSCPIQCRSNGRRNSMKWANCSLLMNMPKTEIFITIKKYFDCEKGQSGRGGKSESKKRGTGSYEWIVSSEAIFHQHWMIESRMNGERVSGYQDALTKQQSAAKSLPASWLQWSVGSRLRNKTKICDGSAAALGKSIFLPFPPNPLNLS